jgi:AraC-like DNA-binding protein
VPAVLCNSDHMGVEKIPSGNRALTSFIQLVDGLPQVMAAAKDIEGRYIYVNVGFAERVGRPARDIVGGTVGDFFTGELAESYAAQDEQVLSTGEPLAGHLELIMRADQRLGWYLTSKTCLVDDQGSVTAIAVLSVDLHAHMNGAHAGLATALREVRSRIDESWRIKDIAVLAGLSTTQLERVCRRTLGMSPRGVLQRLRIEQAARLLSTTSLTAGEIAAACGFYDQSSFTRQFRRVLGLTPGAYRVALTDSDM